MKCQLITTNSHHKLLYQSSRRHPQIALLKSREAKNSESLTFFSYELLKQLLNIL